MKSNSGLKLKFKSISQILNQKGLSLVEVLVTISILGVLGAVIATMMVNSNRQMQQVTAKGDFNSLVNSLQALFNNSNSCFIALGGVVDPDTNVVTTPSGLAIPASASATAPVPVTVDLGGELINAPRDFGSNLQIRKFEFVGRTSAGQNGRFVIPLLITVDSRSGANSMNHTFNLLLTLNATDNIVGCTGQYADLWIRTKANTNNITFMGGNVGIGTETPANLLDVNGTAQAEKFLYKSDRRLKENIREIPDALEKTLGLRGVVFNWIAGDKAENEGDQIGLIAQEVEQIFPELVETHPVSGMKSVAYGNLVAPMIEAIKAQDKLIQVQNIEIAKIKKALSRHERNSEPE